MYHIFLAFCLWGGVFMSFSSQVNSSELFGRSSMAIARKAFVPQAEIGRVAFCSGLIENIEITAGARNPSYTMLADFGSFGKKTSVGQFVNTYHISEMIGKTIWGIINFPPRRIAGVKSEYLTVGFYNEDNHAMALNSFGETPSPGTLLYADLPKDEVLKFEDFSKIEIVVGRIIDFDDRESALDSYMLKVDFGIDRGPTELALTKKLGIDVERMPGKLVCTYVNGDIAPEVLGYQQDDLFIPLSVDENGVTIPLGGYMG